LTLSLSVVLPRFQAVVEEGDKQGFAGVIQPRRTGNGGKDVSRFIHNVFPP
jgi:hypothetical protein